MPRAPSANFSFPVRYRLGWGRRAELGREARAAGIARALLVTDPGVAALPWFGPMCEQARADGLALTVFDAVRSNPVEASVIEGVAAYRDAGCDGLVLVGGGSVIDTGKAIALMTGHQGRVFDHAFGVEGARRIDPAAVAPTIAVPTTAGSGSELSTGAVITDGDAGCKRTLLSPALLPRAVIADPETTAALPPHLTAATGMDALTHALEAWFAPGYHPVADGVALEATRLIATWLPVAWREPDHAEARAHMLMAAGMAAVAFAKGLGLVHAMVHPLGAVTDIHHGLANGVLLPYVLRFNRPAIEERAAPLARHLELDGDGAAFDAVLDRVLALRRELGIPETLAQVGVGDLSLADALAPGAMAERLYLATNPRPVTLADVRGLYREALGG